MLIGFLGCYIVTHSMSGLEIALHLNYRIENALLKMKIEFLELLHMYTFYGLTTFTEWLSFSVLLIYSD